MPASQLLVPLTVTVHGWSDSDHRERIQFQRIGNARDSQAPNLRLVHCHRSVIPTANLISSRCRPNCLGVQLTPTSDPGEKYLKRGVKRCCFMHPNAGFRVKWDLAQLVALLYAQSWARNLKRPGRHRALSIPFGWGVCGGGGDIVAGGAPNPNWEHWGS